MLIVIVDGVEKLNDTTHNLAAISNFSTHLKKMGLSNFFTREIAIVLSNINTMLKFSNVHSY